MKVKEVSKRRWNDYSLCYNRLRLNMALNEAPSFACVKIFNVCFLVKFGKTYKIEVALINLSTVKIMHEENLIKEMVCSSVCNGPLCKDLKGCAIFTYVAKNPVRIIEVCKIASFLTSLSLIKPIVTTNYEITRYTYKATLTLSCRTMCVIIACILWDIAESDIEHALHVHLIPETVKLLIEFLKKKLERAMKINFEIEVIDLDLIKSILEELRAAGILQKLVLLYPPQYKISMNFYKVWRKLICREIFKKCKLLDFIYQAIEQAIHKYTVFVRQGNGIKKFEEWVKQYNVEFD